VGGGGSWPEPVRRAVEAEVGADPVVEPLPGLGGRPVARASGPNGAVVVKQDPHPREVAFYRDVAPLLEPGISVPRAVVVDERSLVLEHVAEPLPRDRWLADTSMMRSLAAVHRSSAARDRLADPFRPSWTPDLTAAAVDRLDPDDRGATARAVDRLSHEAERWLSGEALVSGDPNPLNWGQRLDGTLVLFDWERAGVATPAVDVAITVPGLPTRDQLEIAATAYLAVQHRDHVHWSHDDFTRGLAVAKTWTFVELLAERRDDPALVEVQDRLAAALPGWVAALP
jgi:aminoglycoside phosphotransferase (APT) family kinase protein